MFHGFFFRMWRLCWGLRVWFRIVGFLIGRPSFSVIRISDDTTVVPMAMAWRCGFGCRLFFLRDIPLCVVSIPFYFGTGPEAFLNCSFSSHFFLLSRLYRLKPVFSFFPVIFRLYLSDLLAGILISFSYVVMPNRPIWSSTLFPSIFFSFGFSFVFEGNFPSLFWSQ